eukprot:783847-Pleurochrysis_carterae.AAC.1
MPLKVILNETVPRCAGVPVAAQNTRQPNFRCPKLVPSKLPGDEYEFISLFSGSQSTGIMNAKSSESSDRFPYPATLL